MLGSVFFRKTFLLLPVAFLCRLPHAPAATVIADDVIIRDSGTSIAIGFDAFSGENFGSDTMRLKENNLRIHFDDTSDGGGFPANDWRIVINNTAQNGGEYFVIEDATAEDSNNANIDDSPIGNLFRVDAGNSNNALFVEANSGYLGLGIDNPVVDIHVVRGEDPSIRLDQDNSSGFTPQAWDVVSDDESFSIRDATAATMPFLIRPDSPDRSLVVGSGAEPSSGNVLIGDRPGVTDPQASLHVFRPNGTNKVLVEETDTTTDVERSTLELKKPAGGEIRFNDAASGKVWDVGARAAESWGASVADAAGDEFTVRKDGTVTAGAGGAPVFTLTPTGSLTIAGAFAEPSDRALKEAFREVDPEQILDTLSGLRIVKWRFEEDPEDLFHIGPMAQDFRAAFALGDDPRSIASVDAGGIALVAVKGIELGADDLDRKLDRLDTATLSAGAKLESIRRRLDTLENPPPHRAGMADEPTPDAQ